MGLVWGLFIGKHAELEVGEHCSSPLHFVEFLHFSKDDSKALLWFDHLVSSDWVKPAHVVQAASQQMGIQSLSEKDM